jgi:hypothetical protein
MNYQKFYGKKVMLTCNGLYFGKTGILERVVPTEWVSQTKNAYVLVDGHPIVVKLTDIAIMLAPNKMEEI